MASPIKNLSDNLEETLTSFKNILTFILRNQCHLELSQIHMMKDQEKQFDSLHWMISALNKDDLEGNPPVTLNNDKEEWDVIKANHIFEEDGWVEIPRNV